MRRPRLFFAAAFAVFARAQIKSFSLSCLILLFSMTYAKTAPPLNDLKAAKIGFAAFNQKSRPSPGPIGQAGPAPRVAQENASLARSPPPGTISV
jgi:hypothetical protein